MGRLAQTEGLTEIERDILATVRDFIAREIIPVATELEHRDEYPTQIVEGMKKLGLFGLTIPEEYGGLGESLLIYALVVEEIARGWMSVSGIINTHFIVAHMIARTARRSRRTTSCPGWRPARYAAPSPCPSPAWARTSRRSHQGGPRRRRVRDQRPEDVADQRRHLQPGGGAVPDRRRPRRAAPEHDHLPDREGAGLRPNPAVPGLTVPGKIEKMGYKGVDTTELILR